MRITGTGEELHVPDIPRFHIANDLSASLPCAGTRKGYTTMQLHKDYCSTELLSKGLGRAWSGAVQLSVLRLHAASDGSPLVGTAELLLRLEHPSGFP